MEGGQDGTGFTDYEQNNPAPPHTKAWTDTVPYGHTYITLIQIGLLPQEIVGLPASCLPLNSLDSRLRTLIVKAKEGIFIAGQKKGKRKHWEHKEYNSIMNK